MDYTQGRVTTWVVVLSLALVVLLYPSLWIPSSSTFFSLSSHLRNSSSSSNMTSIPEDKLKIALERASMDNKTVIIAVVNKAYTEKRGILDLFLQSFQLGENTQFLRNHLLVVAIDQTAFNQCNLRHLHCYKHVTEGVDFPGEKVYMSDDFIKMMWSRTLLLVDVLRRGYNFIFTDIDVVWLRNPFTRLSHGGEDFQISCDFYNGNSSDLGNGVNTGFYFVASNNKTIALFDAWYAARNESVGMKEQDVLQLMIHNGTIQRLDLRVRFLDPVYFGGFCANGRDYGKVVTMHANCCRTIKAKIKDLRAFLHGWIKFRAPSNGTSIVHWPVHYYCIKSWRIDPSSTMTPNSNQTSGSSNQTSV